MRKGCRECVYSEQPPVIVASAKAGAPVSITGMNFRFRGIDHIHDFPRQRKAVFQCPGHAAPAGGVCDGTRPRYLPSALLIAACATGASTL